MPEEDIYTEEHSRSTYENALYTQRVLKEKGWNSAIVLTTYWHTRRTKLVFEEVYRGSGITLTYASAKDKRFDGLEEWWEDAEKQQTVLTEWSKLIVYWFKYRVLS